MEEDVTILLVMYFSVPLYWWYHTTLFCKEHVIPLWAANSYFACLLKTEQRKCLCLCNGILRAQWFRTFDVYLNSSMSVKALRSWQRIIEKKNICGEKTKQKWSIEILHRRRGSFEPGACQSFSVFLCEEMSESSLFLLHATSPQSVGKPTAWVGEKLSLWTLKEEREKKNLPCFELSQQQHTQQSYLSRVCMGIGM